MQINRDNNVVTKSTKGLVELVKDTIIGYTIGNKLLEKKGTSLVIKTEDSSDVIELPVEFSRWRKRKLKNKSIEYYLVETKEPLDDGNISLRNEYTFVVYGENDKAEFVQYSHVDYTANKNEI